MRRTVRVRLQAERLEARQMLAAAPIINEFLAANNSSLVDDDGDSSDWIELFNAGDEAVNLGGWHLTDKAADPDKWALPARVLDPGEYWVIFASGKARHGAAPDYENSHANFKLSADGEYLALVEPDGATIAGEFAPQFPQQREDISFGMGQNVVGERLVAAGAAARLLVPPDDSLGLTWTGAAADEPLDDSSAAGWTTAATGIGFDRTISGAGQSEVVGHALTNRPSLDTGSGGVFLLESSSFDGAGVLSQWSIYSTTARQITPLVLQLNDDGDYLITGIGQTQVSGGGGVQQFDFNLQAGSAQVGPEFFFGWKHGADGVNHKGVAPYTSGTADSVRFFSGLTNLNTGANVGPGTPLGRTYSVQATSLLADGPAPLGYWTFDDTAVDATGNGHDGTLQGPTYSSTVPPALGQGRSLNFDGANDYVSVQIDVSEAAYTSSAWFRAESGGRGILSIVDSDLGGGGHDRHVYLNGGNIAARTWNNESITSSGRNFADGQWHHVAHVFGGEIGGQRIYVDGVLVATGSKSFSDFDWQKRLNIGFSNDGAGDYFDGQIDDVAVWSQALSAAQIQALAAGASPLALAGYRQLIATDVYQQMVVDGPSASAYVRIEFPVDPGQSLDSLVLQMKYDDGFVAYLNGVEVARRNAPQNLTFQSTATADRPQSAAINFESIALVGAGGLLREGDNILAIHALNESPSDDDFLLLPELLLVQTDPDRFLSPPTPGAANSAGVVDFVADTRFSIDRGFYDAPLDVLISTATPGASIAYTTDGSIPTPVNGTQVAPPDVNTPPVATVPITTTTNLRAMAYKPDFQPTNVDTHTYIFLADVARQSNVQPGITGWSDFEVDPVVVNTTLPGYGFAESLLSIPTISVTTAPGELWGSNGIYTNSGNRGPAWERAASIEMFHPDGTTEFQIDAGVRMHGNSSRNHGFVPKHPIRVLFKSQWGPSKLVHDLFPDSDVDRFDQILLRGASTDSWPVVDGGSRWLNERGTYIRDQWVRDAQIALGRPSAHGTYVHLYLNGKYWGLYNPSERPTGSFLAEHFGGDKEEWDVLKDFAELREGTKTAWNEMFALADQGLSGDAAYQRIQGNNPDGTRNPNYPVYLDVGNLIDYMIVHIYIGAEDWHQHNWWAGRRRGSESTGFKFFAWDQEISNESLSRTTSLAGTRFEDPYYGGQGPTWLYGRLLANQQFRWRFQDRLHEVMFNDGPLTPENSRALWMARQNEIDLAMVGESARWGDVRDAIPHKRETSWLAEMNWVDNYWVPNHARVLVDRFQRKDLYPAVAAPSFNQQGGAVDEGFLLQMSAPAGVIHYTVDGSDPRTSTGSVSPAATVYSGPFSLTENSEVKARVRQGGQWSALNKATFLLDVPSVTISELNYNPAPATQAEIDAGFADASLFEFLEVFNFGDQPVDLTGVRIVDGVTFDFGGSGSSVSSLDPGEYAVVVKDRQAFEFRYGAGLNVAGEYEGLDERLSNGGERITLADEFNQAFVDFEFKDGWHDMTDGDGFTLTRRDASQRLEDLEQGSAWRPSRRLGGTPATADDGTDAYDPGAIVVNEIMTHSDTAPGDWIELLNTTAANIDVGGWFLSDRRNNATAYQIPPDTIVPAGGFAVLTEQDHFGGVFALSELGSDDDDADPNNDEQVVLTGSIEVAPGVFERVGFQATRRFRAAENGVSFGEHVKSTGGTDFVAMLQPTPGEPNSPPRVGPVVVHEMLYEPVDGGLEYIELKNISSRAVRLEDANNPGATWQLGGGVQFAFPTGVIVPPGGLVLVVPTDEATFRAEHDVPPAAMIFGPYSGALDNAGESVELSMPGPPELDGTVPMILVDRVNYDNRLPWPELPAEGGAAIQRIDAAAYGNDAGNWTASILGGTPGDVPLGVVEVLVRGSTWSPAFVDALAPAGMGEGGFSIGGGLGQLTTLPWTGVDQISIRFAEDVIVTQDHLSLVGVNQAEHTITGFSYDVATWTATWTLAAPLRTDKVQIVLRSLTESAGGVSSRATGRPLDGNWPDDLTGRFPSGNGALDAADHFRFRIDVLPGDADAADGQVTRGDVLAVVLGLGRSAGGPNYHPRHDINGDGLVNVADLRSVLFRFPGTLPSADPAESVASAADAVFDEAGSAAAPAPVPAAALSAEPVAVESSRQRLHRRLSQRTIDAAISAESTAIDVADRALHRGRRRLREE